MGLMKIAQQTNQGKDSFAYRVGFVLVGLMIANVVLAMIKRLIPTMGDTATVIEGVLLIARAIMAVVYGYAIHSLRGDEQGSTEVVKSSDIHDRLDQFAEALRAMGISTEQRIGRLGANTEQRIEQLEANTEQRTLVMTDTFQSFGHTVTEHIQRLEANTDTRLTEQFQAFATTFGELLQRTEANTESRMTQIAAARMIRSRPWLKWSDNWARATTTPSRKWLMACKRRCKPISKNASLQSSTSLRPIIRYWSRSQSILGRLSKRHRVSCALSSRKSR